MSAEWERWIERLGLEKHPEGGYYREVYRSGIDLMLAPGRVGEPLERSVCTSIYYLLGPNDVSRVHRLRSDEIWHHYLGSTVRIHMFSRDSARPIELLGKEPGRYPQLTIPSGTWFGASLEPGGSHALLGCTVAPGFDFRDLEMADVDYLMEEFPERRKELLMLKGR